MKAFRYIIGNLTFVLLVVASASAQTEKPQAINSAKVAFINTEAFDDKKTGIDELLAAYDKLEIEFASPAQELKSMIAALKKMEDGFKTPPEITFEEATRRKKEYDLAVEKLMRRQAEINALYEKREAEETAGIKKKIAETVDLFAREKGYRTILRITKTNEPAILAKSEAADATREFIKYCNEKFAQIKVQ